ncbi:hypothetical protein GIB67_027544 [Kingdonia uniflora]|uniref:Uncharacterized protein n=1 Tax=Kingdonia uniflora TaxID=39325 RepID=A0A7J7NKX6_9MAGN|nr:hypothetical protein GIB67_027544 [Kingdonia uniflora]
MLFSLIGLYICVDNVSSGNVFGRANTFEPYEVSRILNPNQNSLGDFYLNRRTLHPFLWSGDGIDWIATNHACRQCFVLQTLILPCACFLSILRHRVTWLQKSICILIMAVGTVSAIFGTISALSKIIENLSQE